MTRPRLDKEKAMSRGQELYEGIRSEVEPDHRGEVVAIDLETGAYEVAGDIVQAARRLRARLPEAQAWFVRIGHDALFRLGPRSLAKPA